MVIRGRKDERWREEKNRIGITERRRGRKMYVAPAAAASGTQREGGRGGGEEVTRLQQLCLQAVLQPTLNMPSDGGRGDKKKNISLLCYVVREAKVKNVNGNCSD